MTKKLLIWQEGEIPVTIDSSEIESYANHIKNKTLLKFNEEEYAKKGFIHSETIIRKDEIRIIFKDGYGEYDSIILKYVPIDNVKSWNKPDRTITMSLIDPVGTPIKSVSLDYTELCHNIPPEDYPPMNEPMRKNRYIITIGEHQYFVSRRGEIIDRINKESDQVDKEPFSLGEPSEKITPISDLNNFDLTHILINNLRTMYGKHEVSSFIVNPTDFNELSFTIYECSPSGSRAKFIITAKEFDKK